MKKQIYTACFLLVSSFHSTFSAPAFENPHKAVISDSPSKRVVALGIPTLDNLAGDWIPMAQVENSQ